MRIQLANSEQTFYFNNMTRSYVYRASDDVDGLDIRNTLTLSIQNPEAAVYEEAIAFFDNADLSNIFIYDNTDKTIMELKGQSLQSINQNVSGDFNTIQIGIVLA